MPARMRLLGTLLAATPLVAALAFRAPPITVWLAGDSTMAQKQPDKRPETGWGEALQPCFDSSEVRIANRADERSQHALVRRRGTLEGDHRQPEAGRLRVHPVRPQRREGRHEQLLVAGRLSAATSRSSSTTCARSGRSPCCSRRSCDGSSTARSSSPTHGAYPDAARAAATRARTCRSWTWSAPAPRSSQQLGPGLVARALAAPRRRARTRTTRTACRTTRTSTRSARARWPDSPSTRCASLKLGLATQLHSCPARP